MPSTLAGRPGPILQDPPTQSDLERLYFELAQHGAPSLGRKVRWPYGWLEGLEGLIALAAEMLRYDPRLLGILTQLLLYKWETLDLIVLRRMMHRMRHPRALCVVCEFAREAAPGDQELCHVLRYLTAGWPKQRPAERFFLDIDKPASRLAQRRLGRNLQPYARWGYVAIARPTLSAHNKRALGRYDAATRRQILKELLASRGSLSVSEYLQAIDGGISRQQALRDLRSLAGATPTGAGRGSRWQLTTNWSDPRPGVIG